jgi:hypothetical protein
VAAINAFQMHGKRNRALVPTIDSVTDEGRSTDEARILPETGAYDRYVLKGLDCIAADDGVDIVDQEIECLRDAAAHDDPFWAEKMDQAGKPRAEIGGLFAEQREARRIALARAFHNVAALDYLRCGPDAEQAFGMHRCLLAGAASERRSRGESFEASDRPARANWPFERHAKMPDMARHATTAVQQPTIHHNPAADPSADGHIDEVPQAATSAIEPFTECRSNAVVLEQDRQAKIRCQNFPQSEPFPFWERWDA